MADTVKLINGLGRIVEIPIEVPGKEKTEEQNDKLSDVSGQFSRKDDLIVGIRVAAMHIYSRADKYVDELTNP